jgi:hypothetical protein
MVLLKKLIQGLKMELSNFPDTSKQILLFRSGMIEEHLILEPKFICQKKPFYQNNTPILEI